MLIEMVSLATTVLAGCQREFDGQPGVGVLESLMLPMRDGVKLHTNIISKTNRTKRVPTVIDRSPYGSEATELIADIYSALGDYVAIGQDMRGTCKSEGNFSIWRLDGLDSYDTMEWIAQQPWSNGQIHTVGASADGIAEFVIIKEQPKWLVSQFEIFATIDARTTIYPGGAYHHSLVDGWLKGTVGAQAPGKIAGELQHRMPYTLWHSRSLAFHLV